jgi:superfamily I DNA/RNA helicase
MKVKKRKEIVAKGKAAVAMRRSVGWTRETWINEVESALAEAFIIFCQARLAENLGQRRHVRALAGEFDRVLFRRMIDVHVYPVKREFDRRKALEDAVAAMSSTIERLRDHVEREFGRVVGRLRQGIDDRDVEMFWSRAREAARILSK